MKRTGSITLRRMAALVRGELKGVLKAIADAFEEVDAMITYSPETETIAISDAYRN